MVVDTSPRLSGALLALTPAPAEQARKYSAPPAILIEKLTKHYNGARGIIDLDLHVEEGEIFGFLGPNGAGKTTTIRVLMDLIRPSSGRATIFGRDCRSDSVHIKSLIGYLPGELALWDNLTGRQILIYLSNLRGAIGREYAWHLAERLELDLSRKFREYSKGNKQKVGLVQAFMHRPRLLILDEPTSGLDPLNQQEFFRMVAEARSEGTTIFLSSHVLSEVEQICDRVAIIREGYIVRLGPVRDLLAERQYTVTLTLDRDVTSADRAAFYNLPSICDLQFSADTLSFTVRGPVQPALQRAASLPVVTISSREPTLEEAFLHYYRSDTQ